MHMMTSIAPGQISYLTSTNAVFAWPLDAQPKLWSLKSKNASFLNLASDFSASRGTYIAAYDSNATKGFVNLISHQNDVTGLST